MQLVKVGPENLAECGIGCLSNRKNPGFAEKSDWLRERFSEGLRFLLFRDANGKPLAFLEYVPGAYAWRPVHAKGWLFVHCLWVYPAGQKIGGLGGRLIRACVEEARAVEAIGACAIVSEGPWMAGREGFLRNGFEPIAEAGRFQLVAHRLKDGPAPRFRDLPSKDGMVPGSRRRPPVRSAERGLEIVYAPQCPLLRKSVDDLTAVAKEEGLELKVSLLSSAREAQSAPSHYGVFQLLFGGHVLSDHYVSATRFRSLLRKAVRRAG